MSTHRVLQPHQLPVLTEILEAPHAAAHAGEPGPATPELPLALDAELIERVRRELDLQINLMLEARLRELLTPAMARATDQLIRDTRENLAEVLGELVSRAVVQELSRSR